MSQVTHEVLRNSLTYFSIIIELMKLLSLLPLLGLSLAQDPVPTWPSSYKVKGVLSIPFAEIMEPFAAWVDLDMKKSRIDYYDGMVKTFQRGDLAASVKVRGHLIYLGNNSVH